MTWGDTFNRHKATGMDPSDAAFRTDLSDPMRKRRAEVENERLREALVQADLKIRSLPGMDQSDVEFIREALGGNPQEADPAVVLTGGEDALDVLSSLASYLGVGLGDETTTAEQFDKRIRWGIDNHTNGTIRLCGAVVERLSQEPYTTWGDIKKAILDLIQDTTLDGLPSDIPSPSKDLQHTEGEAE